jgi:hypothetical protein
MSRRRIHTIEATALSAKVHRDPEWKEYVVSVVRNDNGNVLADYHTDDKEDAIATAKAMLQEEEQAWWANQGFDADNSTHCLHLFEDGSDPEAVVPCDTVYLDLSDVDPRKQLSTAVAHAEGLIANSLDLVKVEVVKDMGHGHIAVLATVY